MTQVLALERYIRSVKIISLIPVDFSVIFTALLKYWLWNDTFVPLKLSAL